MAKTQITFAKKIVGGRIAAYDARGNAFILLHNFREGRWGGPKLTATLERVRAAGEIDLRFWRSASAKEA